MATARSWSPAARWLPARPCSVSPRSERRPSSVITRSPRRSCCSARATCPRSAAPCHSGIEITVAGPELLDAIDAAAGEMGRMARIHLKIDTGMHRYGASPADALATGRPHRRSLEHVELAGLSTHYAPRTRPSTSPAREQAAIFEQVAAQIRVRIGRPFALHVGKQRRDIPRHGERHRHRPMRNRDLRTCAEPRSRSRSPGCDPRSA